MKNMLSDNLVLYDCTNSTTVVSYLSRSEKLAEFIESVIRTCSATWLTLWRKTTILKVSCFKIDFVHVLPSPLLAPEGILDEIISIV